MSTSITFYADAVLFDMDGTITDSIAAVEAAWGKVANDLGLDPAFVIAATHGKRAVDNLAQFKPHLKAHEIEVEVAAFEQTILDFADAFSKDGLGSSMGTRKRSTSQSSFSSSSGSSTPSLFDGYQSACSSRSSLDVPSAMTFRLPPPMKVVKSMSQCLVSDESLDWSKYYSGVRQFVTIEVPIEEVIDAWKLEARLVDRSIRILPGVKRMIESIPHGRYAVATSGAKTYAYGAMTRVGITPPPVTITADDKRLKAGKPSPDPFLLAAKCLGFAADRCVVFEDSPSGIRAGVASGAVVIAVCTSHTRAQIENCGAHFIVDNMESVTCEVVEVKGEMQLKFKVQY